MLATARAASTRSRVLAAGARMALFAYSSLVHITLRMLRCGVRCGCGLVCGVMCVSMWCGCRCGVCVWAVGVGVGAGVGVACGCGIYMDFESGFSNATSVTQKVYYGCVCGLWVWGVHWHVIPTSRMCLRVCFPQVHQAALLRLWLGHLHPVSVHPGECGVPAWGVAGPAVAPHAHPAGLPRPPGVVPTLRCQ
jgi:hypothetical protein